LTRIIQVDCLGIYQIVRALSGIFCQKKLSRLVGIAPLILDRFRIADILSLG
jgi:hypothetical protein